MICCTLDKYRDWGLLLLRLGIGGMFVFAYGWGKISNPGGWEQIGSAIGHLGVPVFAPKFWGFMAAFAEFGGGIMLLLGLLFRPATFLMFCVMVTAVATHASMDPPNNNFNHPLELAILFASLFIIGPGRFSLDGLGKRFCRCPIKGDVSKTDPPA
jgi:putative oxidoreductase